MNPKNIELTYHLKPIDPNIETIENCLNGAKKWVENFTSDYTSTVRFGGGILTINFQFK